MTSAGETNVDKPVLKVRVDPEGLTVEVEPGETVFEAAERQGITWPTICAGMGSCRACFMAVLSGADQLDPVGGWEQEGIDSLGAVGRGGSVLRLACQATVNEKAPPGSEVVVFKRGVRRPDAEGN